MLPSDVQNAFAGKELLDFGIEVKEKTFAFHDCYAVLPNSLVIAYALALVTSGQARQLLLAGFDGYAAGDPRTTEMQQVFNMYMANQSKIDVAAITPSRYLLPARSIYAM